MFYCCFSFSARNLRALSVDRRKTLPRDRKYVLFYNLRRKISRALPPKKIKAKNVQNSVLFRTTSDFDREYLRNGWRYPESENYSWSSATSVFGGKSSINFGPLKTKLRRLMFTHQNQLFRNIIYCRPLGVAAPSIFLHALEIDQGLLAHSPPETRDP